jgi:hypothetical protein
MWRKYNCFLCETETENYLCRDCERIKKIIELYSVDTVRKSLDEIFIRETIPIEKRTEIIANKINTRSKVEKKSSN